MASTFMGLETSKRGLAAQQAALYTTGHNISNANTIGYSRQTVQMAPTTGYPGVGMNTPQTPGFLGTGVQATSVTRIRDQFVDNQFRQQTTQLGYWGTKTATIAQMEDILTEPSTYGLNTAFDSLFESFQDLSARPEDAAARQVAVEKAAHFADTFNYLSTQLTQIQTNLKTEINAEVANVNSVLKQIAELNKQIASIEPNGYLPNDLYDARDTLVDQLSQYFPVEIVKENNGGNSKDIAEGTYNVFIKLSDGTKLQVVSKKESAILTAQGAVNTTDANGVVTTGEANFDLSETFTPFTQLTVKLGENGQETPLAMNQLAAGTGKIQALVDSYGSVSKDATTGVIADPSTATGLYAEKLAELDVLAKSFADAFNEQHKAGYTLSYTDANGTVVPSTNGLDFFVAKDPTKPISATNIKVSDAITNDLNLIAASSKQGTEGNGTNATALAKIKTKVLGTLNNASAQSFYQSLVADLGVTGQQAKTMQNNASTMQLTIANNRASISSVDLDEEMTNMITFQQAYNASARMITVMDETLDKIINGMGRVGL